MAFWQSARAVAFALAAARAIRQHAPQLEAKDMVKSALEIAADICVFTNHNIIVEEIE